MKVAISIITTVISASVLLVGCSGGDGVQGPPKDGGGGEVSRNGYIFFTRNETGLFQMYRLNVDTGEVKFISTQEDPRKKPPESHPYPLETADKVYFTSDEGTALQSVKLLPIATNKREVIVATSLDDLRPESGPVSPGGDKILFTRQLDKDTRIRHIFSADLDGKNPVDLGAGSNPSWSPDGARIVFYDPVEDNLKIMDADGANRTTIDGTAGFSAPQWGPKDDEIVCLGPPFSGEVKFIKVSDLSIRTLSIPGVSFVAWRFDGTKIFYITSGGLQDNDLIQANPDGTDVKAILTTPEIEIHGSWVKGP
jgi:Tol biopolymer transport system component